ncbi:recombinase RecT [Salinarimonas soli]|uniref:Recombinase RecT n=1 Tax=Salinarimonas soli TaxID=1638099 RepID=A0A5B2VGG1_9HYPH|nr:recombinase RecT [Salinarimonas soli]KAA2237718.1 recombinase RecT [Salinarimonas soli]
MAHALTLTATEQRIAERLDPAASKQIAVSDAAGGVAFADVSQVMEFAKLMAISQIAVPKHLRGNPGACVAVCVQALEWRMSPYAVANKSYSVNDRLAYEAQLVQAVILQRAPIKGRIKTEYDGLGEKRTCRVWAELADSPGEVVAYLSPAFGTIQPKNSPLWKNDPDQQLHYYSVRAWCRRHFPDVLLGVYAKDEIDDTRRPGPEGARDVTPRGLSGKLDALGGTAPVPDDDPDDETGTDDVFGATGDAGDASQVGDAGGGAGEDSEPTIDPKSPDFAKGVADRRAGIKKCLKPEIKDDPQRFATWRAGFDSVEQEG